MNIVPNVRFLIIRIGIGSEKTVKVKADVSAANKLTN